MLSIRSPALPALFAAAVMAACGGATAQGCGALEAHQSEYRELAKDTADRICEEGGCSEPYSGMGYEEGGRGDAGMVKDVARSLRSECAHHRGSAYRPQKAVLRRWVARDG